MPAMFLKRTLTWSIPTALACLAIQYHDSGRISAYAVIVSLVVFLLAGVAMEALDSWRKRTFGRSPFALAASALFWFAVAIGLFMFFYRMR